MVNIKKKSRIKEIKEEILKALTEKEKYPLGNLVGGFMALLVGIKAIEITRHNLK